ncbi:MAG: GTP pyrophosphokinase family protein, partial [Candidatus Methylumidiphilus sp.]
SLSAIRIITFFPRTIEQIDAMLREEFEIIERSDKSEDLHEKEKFGYQSVHYLVKFNAARASLSEYQRFADSITEVQVRTILQHAWAEIEHGIQYKSPTTIPTDIRRRFMALAGLLEIADREFQAIQDDDRALTEKAESLVNSGRLEEVEITPSALKTYLNKKLGLDNRMSDFSYDWTARLLKKLGFKNFQQVDDCIRPYDDDKLSRLLVGNRQGQLTRFEYMLLAAMGEKYIERHYFAGQEWYGKYPCEQLEKLKKEGFDVGVFDPLPENVPAWPAPANPS